MLPLTVADIAPNDERFLSEGCGEWSDELTPIAEPGRPFGDGTYIVGLDIAPGRYRAAAPSDSCYWVRLAYFRIFGGKHGFADIRTTVGGWEPTVRGGDTSSVVDILPSDAGFYSEGCGTWSGDLTPIAVPGEPFADGTYFVGSEIAPGRYRARAIRFVLLGTVGRLQRRVRLQRQPLHRSQKRPVLHRRHRTGGRRVLQRGLRDMV